MKISSKLDKEKFNELPLTITITMNISEWIMVKEATNKGKDGYYGPSMRFIEGVEKTIESYEKRTDFEIKENK